MADSSIIRPDNLRLCCAVSGITNRPSRIVGEAPSGTQPWPTACLVTNARARVGSVGISAEQAADPVKLAEFQKAQGELSGALSRLLVVSENYPDLKSNQNFLELQAQLEGTENRITVARNRYIQSVQAYNVHIRQFPVNMTAKMFGYDVKPNFTVENEAAISKPPTVEFAPANPPPSN